MALVILLIAACMSQRPTEDEAQREWARLEGSWQRVSYETEGRKDPLETAARFTLTLRRDGTYAVHVDDKVVIEGKASIDATQKPKTVDMTPLTGLSKGRALLGIYELDGEVYRICYAPAGKERPRGFSTEKGSGHVLIVYRRKK